MDLEISEKARKKIIKILAKNPGIEIYINKAINQFIEDKYHPGLRLHKLSGKQNTQWSISINMKLRMLLYIKDNYVIITDIGSHDEVY